MANRLWRLRFAALLSAGAFAVHQLRFLLAFGHSASGRLALEGHAYLVPVAPLVVWLLLALVVQIFAGSARSGAAPSLRRTWLVASVSLFVVYCVQESLEALIVQGHPGGVSGVLGSGGWLAAPLSLVVGLVVALLMRAARAADSAVRARRPWAPPRALAVAAAIGPARMLFVPRRRTSPLTARGPPLASV